MSAALETYYEITYFGTGMSPQILRVNSEEQAFADWERFIADPYKGASSLRKVVVLRQA